MKAYIWHFEYDYIVALAENEDEARKLAIKIVKEYNSVYGNLGSRSSLTDEEVVNLVPGYVITENKSMICNHSNE